MIFRILFVETPQPLNTVLFWAKSDEPKFKSAMERLVALRILEQVSESTLLMHIERPRTLNLYEFKFS